MAKDETKKAEKVAAPNGESITLVAGATVRDADGRPRKIAAAVAVRYAIESGRCIITEPMEFIGSWFDMREV